MGNGTLTHDKVSGVKASILVAMLVLVLFAVIMVAGRPIMDFRTELPSVAYAVIVYTPVMVLCFLAYRRLRLA